MKRTQIIPFQLFVHIGALVPFVLLVWDAWTGNLTVNPIQEATLRTGKTALVLLIFSLSATPIASIIGFRDALRVRRPLGLYAFFYASIHFLIFVGLDYTFNWPLLKGALFEKRYALVGFTAFLILLPLAVTSTKGWQRRLRKHWKNLHRLVYLAAVLVIVHYVWLVKADIREPLAYGAVVGLLLLARVSSVRRWASRIRYRLPRRNKASEKENRVTLRSANL
jgi:sulfoxide reductase heme-binding subunit YedZ